MSKFRLTMARCQGELKAKEMGFDSFPVDPFAIAAAEDIMVEPKPPERPGVSGGIIFLDDRVGIFYATEIVNEGFRRFTVSPRAWALLSRRPSGRNPKVSSDSHLEGGVLAGIKFHRTRSRPLRVRPVDAVETSLRGHWYKPRRPWRDPDSGRLR